MFVWFVGWAVLGLFDFFIIPKYNLHKKYRLDSVTTTDPSLSGLNCGLRSW